MEKNTFSDADNKKKVLIIKLSSLGDVIFNVPLANVLKQNGYEVSWLVGEKGFDIAYKYGISSSTMFTIFTDNDIISPYAQHKTVKLYNENMKKAIRDNSITESQEKLFEQRKQEILYEALVFIVQKLCKYACTPFCTYFALCKNCANRE